MTYILPSASGSSFPSATPSQFGPVMVPGETRVTRAARASRLALMARVTSTVHLPVGIEDLVPIEDPVPIADSTPVRTPLTTLESVTAQSLFAAKNKVAAQDTAAAESPVNAVPTTAARKPRVPKNLRGPFILPPSNQCTPHPTHGFLPVNSTPVAGFHSPSFGQKVENTARLARRNKAHQSDRRRIIEPWLSRRGWARKAAAVLHERGLTADSDHGHFCEPVEIVVDETPSEFRLRMMRAPDGYAPSNRRIGKREKTFDSFFYRNTAERIMLVLDSREEKSSRIALEEMNWIVEWVRTHSWETLIHDDWMVACKLFEHEMGRFIGKEEMRKKWYFFLDWVAKIRGKVYAGRFVKRLPGL